MGWRLLIILLTLWLAGIATMWAYPPLEYVLLPPTRNLTLIRELSGPDLVDGEEVVRRGYDWRSKVGVFGLGFPHEFFGVDMEVRVNQGRLWLQWAAWTGLVGGVGAWRLRRRGLTRERVDA